jgi:hypothetical protein
MRLAVELLKDHYEAAAHEWGNAITALNSRTTRSHIYDSKSWCYPDATEAADNTSNWLRGSQNDNELAFKDGWDNVGVRASDLYRVFRMRSALVSA